MKPALAAAVRRAQAPEPKRMDSDIDPLEIAAQEFADAKTPAARAAAFRAAVQLAARSDD